MRKKLTPEQQKKVGDKIGEEVALLGKSFIESIFKHIEDSGHLPKHIVIVISNDEGITTQSLGPCSHPVCLTVAMTAAAMEIMKRNPPSDEQSSPQVTH